MQVYLMNEALLLINTIAFNIVNYVSNLKEGYNKLN